jgi:hypothetical protein
MFSTRKFVFSRVDDINAKVIEGLQTNPIRSHHTEENAGDSFLIGSEGDIRFHDKEL